MLGPSYESTKRVREWSRTTTCRPAPRVMASGLVVGDQLRASSEDRGMGTRYRWYSRGSVAVAVTYKCPPSSSTPSRLSICHPPAVSAQISPPSAACRYRWRKPVFSLAQRNPPASPRCAMAPAIGRSMLCRLTHVSLASVCRRVRSPVAGLRRSTRSTLCSRFSTCATRSPPGSHWNRARYSSSPVPPVPHSMLIQMAARGPSPSAGRGATASRT
mmetsp:Transcript_49746/g.158885  ORF Transcript_49746/g.158885 Transcript_49746/m.158885 type:complete len:216 (+) Transcript_49746:956-1603(+)